MKKQTTSDRLKQIMSERNLRQVDILEMCKPYCQKYNIKLGRNDLSQYVTGKVEPGQKKLTVLGMALNVSEAWLMGFDVPMEKTQLSASTINELTELLSKFSKSDVENMLAKKIWKNQAKITEISAYLSLLNDKGKEAAVNRVKELTYIPKYQKNTENSSIVKNITDFRKSITGMAIDAAHARTDIEVPEGVDTSDDDVFDNF